jgi:hypothetical protein
MTKLLILGLVYLARARPGAAQVNGSEDSGGDVPRRPMSPRSMR